MHIAGYLHPRCDPLRGMVVHQTVKFHDTISTEFLARIHITLLIIPCSKAKPFKVSLRAFCKVFWTRDHCPEYLYTYFEGRLMAIWGKSRRSWGDDTADWTEMMLPVCTTAERNRKSWREVVHRPVISGLQ